jgi:nucleotide-binding universal stress UspA family protein
MNAALPPPRRVLAAVDFSECSINAMKVASALARHCGAELHVLYAIDPALAAAAIDAHVNLECEAREELRACLLHTATRVESPPHLHLVQGDAPQVIIDIAQRERIELIVIGSRGQGIPEWPALGTTAEQVVRRSLTSVLLVPPDWEADRHLGADLTGFGPILAGIDMTCPSITAATEACRLAATLKTRVTLLHAVAPPQVPERFRALAGAAADRKYAQSRNDYTRVAHAIQGTCTVPATLEIAHGPVVDVLLAACRTERYALVVLARSTTTHDYGAPGAVASRMLMLARVPVLMHVAA